MDLTSLATVKAWLFPADSSSTTDDVMLGRLITQLSGATLNYLGRPDLTRSTYTELRDGVGNSRMTLRNWPVVSVSSLIVNGATIPAAGSMTQGGYTLSTWDGTTAGTPQELTLNGYTFCRGKNNVQVTYDAGYCVINQAFSVMTASPYVVAFTPPYGSWAADNGVTYSTGVALTKVAATATPTTGQYKVSQGPLGDVTYTFSVGDASAAVKISYSYVPAALEQAVVEWIGERYRYKDRIGQTSKSLGGNETAAYSLKAVPDFIASVFDNYKKFMPL